MFVWWRPWLERRPGERRPREEALPRLGDRGAMKREEWEEPRNGCGEGEARLRAADRLIRPYDPADRFEPALFLSATAWECRNRVNNQMP